MTLADRNLCSGCSACSDICPKECIKMTPDREGFPYPEIDPSLCIECGACRKACPVLCKPVGVKPKRAYAYINPDPETVEHSSSGGAFTALATKILSEGGAVVGALLDENLRAHHAVVESVDGLSALRGSKYVESDTVGIFKKVKKLISTGRSVLFSGTPCQTAAARSYIGECDLLITVELACHGVPSPLVFERYIEYLEKTHGARVVGFNFRHKKSGWRSYGTRALLEDGRELFSTVNDDPYMRAFLSDACLRPSCHACAFKETDGRRYADILIGDFWGVEKIFPEIDGGGGVSLVIVHTERGGELFSSVTEGVVLKETDPDTALTHNGAVIRSVKAHPKRATFMSEVVSAGFGKESTALLRPSLTARIKSKIKRIIKRLLKR